MRKPPVVLVLALLAAAAAPATAEEAWEWSVAPYLWGAGISGSTNLPDRGTSGIEVDAGDILESIEIGGMLRVDGHSERWRFLGDAAYLGLGRRTDRGLAEQDFDATMLEAAGAWRANEHFEVLFGARYWDLGMDIDFDDPLIPDVKRGRDWVDPIVGIAATGALGESWRVWFRGDVGGFGAGSDLSWNGELLFLWNATERFSLAFGYRHLAVENDCSIGAEDLELDVALSGPEIGFAFRF